MSRTSTGPRDARPDATTPGFSESLGILGWRELDPLLLGALATEAPVLLIGGHGTGKTLLVERVARALRQEFRHYNASLVNYDDLVGIPLPTEDGDLRFVGTKGAIWGAEFLFFDEINRCRPDLQNKLFPVIHERRLAGSDLPELRHRWAAMNPPGGGDGGYLGTEALDVALADRFPVIIRVPEWSTLTRAERERIASGNCDHPEQNAGEHIEALLRRTIEELTLVEATHRETIASYTVTLTDLLAQSGVLLSARRARMLTRNILATIAAATALDRGDTAEALAELSVRSGLPQLAESEPLDPAKIVAAHVQAWEVTVTQKDPVKRRLLEEPDPVERLRLGLEHKVPEDLLATLTLGALASRPAASQQIALAVTLTRALATHDLTPAAWSTLTEKAKPVLTPQVVSTLETPGPRLEGWRVATQIISRERSRGTLHVLEEALLAGCGPALLADGPTPEELVTEFRGYLKAFGVTS
jgi:MoxR-like ATPase